MANSTKAWNVSKKTLDSLRKFGYICVRKIEALSEKASAMAKSTYKHEGKMIHIRLPDELHRHLRIRVAQDETTMQDFIVALLKRALKPKKR